MYVLEEYIQKGSACPWLRLLDANNRIVHCWPPEANYFADCVANGWYPLAVRFLSGELQGIISPALAHYYATGEPADWDDPEEWPLLLDS